MHVTDIWFVFRFSPPPLATATWRDRLKVSPPPSPPLPFPLSVLFLPSWYLLHTSPSPPVPFVTTIVTCGCLCPTMHCNPPASPSLVVERQWHLLREERWGEERGGGEGKDEPLQYWKCSEGPEGGNRNAHLELSSLCIQLSPLISAQMNLPFSNKGECFTRCSKSFLAAPPSLVFCADNCFSLVTTALKMIFILVSRLWYRLSVCL